MVLPNVSLPDPSEGPGLRFTPKPLFQGHSYKSPDLRPPSCILGLPTAPARADLENPPARPLRNAFGL
ncbi:hypothetical protein RQM65_03150 [Pricia sp. S334]|uniref:Uncharacterized protein n=1 Tax=Pricia mediterranea TaxID=3076079 RepID=A0ABU3L2L2_9FLAO|nr:hypothetical protein [Pricia sp. S334]MDT7827651.1 hypothetical protein [Pricia sp. S334]MDT7827657.1 hypothetical protein [Pricia sp. S334]MDT7827662.1 hypothetical protein [Pricia sp. S334]